MTKLKQTEAQMQPDKGEIMSIFDNLKKAAGGAAKAAVKAAAAAAKEEKQTFTFAVLPESVDELKALPEAALASPFQTAALTVCHSVLTPQTLKSE